jgi:predicted enzyme related to lactoylglutathione lyase
MRKFVISMLFLFVTSFMACTNQTQSSDQKVNQADVAKTVSPMNNVVSIVEIPVTDLARASQFYQNILNVSIEKVEMGETQMGVIPNDIGTVNVVLVKGSDYTPTTDGAVIYLNAGKDLQPMLEKVEKSGGQVIVPKTEISAEMGFFALFIDTEGNKLGLHSAN